MCGRLKTDSNTGAFTVKFAKFRTPILKNIPSDCFCKKSWIFIFSDGKFYFDRKELFQISSSQALIFDRHKGRHIFTLKLLDAMQRKMFWKRVEHLPDRARDICNQVQKAIATLQQQKHPPEVFYKKSVLENLVKFTGKNLCQSLFFDKFAGLRPETLLKKRLWHKCFPVNFAKYLRTPFYRSPPGDCFYNNSHY